MPQNTLLEPNNVIPSWECGGEEIKEVSATMRKLRQQYDNVHRQVTAKEKELDRLKRRLEQQQNEECFIEDVNYDVETEITSTKDEMEKIKEASDFEMMKQRQYKHMIQRIQADLIATKIKVNEKQESYQSKLAILEEEIEKKRKATQQRLQAQHRLESFMLVIDEDHRQRGEEMGALDKSIQNKKSALQRRISRMKRQQVIAEQAANEKKDSNELKMQENFLAQKFWSAFLKTKMEKEMRNNAPYEKAFQEIRAATGYSDVQNIVDKFLNRESIYSDLLRTVQE